MQKYIGTYCSLVDYKDIIIELCGLAEEPLVGGRQDNNTKPKISIVIIIYNPHNKHNNYSIYTGHNLS